MYEEGSLACRRNLSGGDETQSNAPIFERHATTGQVVSPMEKPLVSAFVPCFRMKRYLPGFLGALPKQTYFDRLQVVLDHNIGDFPRLVRL